ncbi:hypothetical protein CANARDRAFT_187513, partial [[Candida] arabinofermentans NRRL YB-2248]
HSHNCKNCALPIQEGHAYELGGDRWHVNCFKCSKCDKLLGVNSNFLVLGTGALVCSDCSYSCKSCNKKIYDMAILTGDQAYCASCFKCKSCKKPIEDLRYARTSKGLFCMPCHHKLMEKKKKYEAMRLVKQKQLAAAASRIEPKEETTEPENTSKSSKSALDDISDPGEQLTPTTTEKIEVTTPQRVTKSPVVPTKDSFGNIEYVTGSPIAQRREPQLLTIPLRSPMRSGNSPIQQLTSEFQTPKLQQHSGFDAITPGQRSELLIRQLSLSPTRSVHNKSPMNLRAVVSPRNRDAFVFDEAEPDSFIDLGDDDEDDDADDDDGEESKLSDDELRFDHHSYMKSPIRSPHKNPPTSSIPQTPDRQSVPIGLNITGLNMSNQDDGEAASKKAMGSPVLSKKETFSGTSPHVRKTSGSITRSLSLKKVFHRHKRSTSSTGAAGGNSDRIQSLRDASSPHMEQDEIFTSQADTSQQTISTFDTFDQQVNEHKRTASDHSTTAYMTPPLPKETSFHTRSQSETIYESSDITPTQMTQFEPQLRMLKSEVTTLTLEKTNLLKEIQQLQTQKRTLEMEINDRQLTIKELDSLAISKQTANTSTESVFKPSTTSNITSSSPPPSSASSDRPKKSGFMRRIFGNNSNGLNGQTSANGMSASPSIQSISSPMNFRQGDDAILSLGQTYQSGTNGMGISAMIKSRSSNFMALRSSNGGSVNGSNGNGNGNGNNGHSVANGTSYSNDKSLFKTTLQERANYEKRPVPFIVTRCLIEVQSRGLTTEGVYRVSGSSLNIDKIEKLFDNLDINNEKEVAKLSTGVLDGDIHVVAGLLKRYLKKLPDPVIPYRNYDHYLEISKIENEDIKSSQLKMLLNDLPLANLNVLHQLADHLSLVVQNESFTKMTFSSLATVFAPTLVRDNSMNAQREILDNTAKTITTEFLLRHHNHLF